MADVLEVLLDGSRRKEGDMDYGVFHDEMKTLASEEDTWDMTPPGPPNPPFCDVTSYVPWKTIPTTEGDVVLNYASLGQIRPGYTLAVFGKRRSGKTALMIAIMRHVRSWFRNVVVFTKTIASCEFNSHCPNSVIIEGVDKQILSELLERQKERNRIKSHGHVDGGNDRLLLVFEDCMASGELRGGELFESLFYNGRHYETTIIVALQDIKGLRPGVVQNCDLCYVFPMDDFRGIEAMYEKWFYFLQNKKQVLQLMTSPFVNQIYHVLCIDIAHKSHPPHQRLTYGAIPQETMTPFVMGNRDLWAQDMGQLQDIIKLYNLPDLIHNTNWDVD